MVKLSKTSKMPAKSWSLPALATCPGARENGELVPACAGCYATDGMYRMPSVQKPREHNQRDWERHDWIDDMVEAIGSDKYFRWFDSGDMYSVRLAWKIYMVCLFTPDTQHWIPTRMSKFPKFYKVLEELAKLDNVVVRHSSDSITGGLTEHAVQSTIIPAREDLPDGATLCSSIDNDGKCGDCRACWNKEVPVVAYVAHGRKMTKLIKAINL